MRESTFIRVENVVTMRNQERFVFANQRPGGDFRVDFCVILRSAPSPRVELLSILWPDSRASRREGLERIRILMVREITLVFW